MHSSCERRSRSKTREVERGFTLWQQPSYRVGQLLEWLYNRRAATWDEMTNLPKALRQSLAEAFPTPMARACPQTRRSEFHPKIPLAAHRQRAHRKRSDPGITEALYGEASDRRTLCVSTQVGCAYGCKFCASGLEGWKRNLEPHEIINQVLAIERLEGKPGGGTDRVVNNLVIMGMGEPLANYENLLKALKTLNAPWKTRQNWRRAEDYKHQRSRPSNPPCRGWLTNYLAISLHTAPPTKPAARSCPSTKSIP